MNTLICPDSHNPYSNNPHAHEKEPRSHVVHKGKHYTKFLYEVKIPTLTRLIKIIQVIAFTVITCFLALAFQSTRKLWSDGITGKECVNVLMPQYSWDSEDVAMHIASFLSLGDLLFMGATSTHNNAITKTILMNRLNAGTITPHDLGINNVTHLIEYFGTECSKIIRLDLQNFSPLNTSDIEKISEHFKNVNYLLLLKCTINDDAIVHFTNMNHLKSLTLEECEQLNNVNLLQNCKELTTLDFSGSTHIQDFSFLQNCPKIKSINFAGCHQINDFRFLKNCTEITALKFWGCSGQINDISFLEHCPHITSLKLIENEQINDFSFLNNCPNLIELDLSDCCHINDFSFLQNCRELASLSLRRCQQIDDFSFLQYCKNLTSLNLSDCTHINDFNFLQFCPHLTSLDLSGCKQITDGNFLQLCPHLTSLDLSFCDQINNIFFLQYCKKLTSLDLASCKQIIDISFLEHCPRLRSLNLSWFRQINEFNIQALRTRGVIIKC